MRRRCRCSGGEADKQSLREQLANNATASRSERDANAQLAHAAGGAGQQQIGGVAAGDQKHDGHGAEQQPKQRTNVAHGAVNEVLHRAPQPCICGVELVEPRHDGGHLRLRLGDGDAGLEAGDGISARIVTVGHLMRSKGQRDPDLRCLVLRFSIGQIGTVRILEPLRHDADDLVIFAVEQQRAMENVSGRPEHGLPERVADDGDFFVARLVVIGSDVPAEFGSGLKSSKEIAIDTRRADAFRRALRSQTEDRLIEGGHVLKGVAVAASGRRNRRRRGRRLRPAV